MDRRSDIILTVFILFVTGGVIWYFVKRGGIGGGPPVIAGQGTLTPAQLAQAQYVKTNLNQKAGGAGNWAGNGLKSADNLATGVCPIVGAAYKVPVQVGNYLCPISRKLDPVHYVVNGASWLLNKI